MDNLNLLLDFNCVSMDFDCYVNKINSSIENAFKLMDEIESGESVNIDEKRMVGHYWLRNTSIAPNEKIRNDITEAIKKIMQFTEKIHAGQILSQNNKKFKHLIVVGIGGSQLGFQFISKALYQQNFKMIPYSIDNSDPEGIDMLCEKSGIELSETLVIFISKSGGTVEVKNALIEIENIFNQNNICFSHHAVAIAAEGTELYQLAKREQWLSVFPTWNWVGGRVSVLSPVGLLPLSLLGIDIKKLLSGAEQMDKMTRHKNIYHNPAMLLSIVWHYFTETKNIKTMVILPYKDRLDFLSRYLQQLVMESLGKNKDLDGEMVNAGITVYGNKGSTDQHAYVQQLREGPNDFFTTFFLVKKDREGESPIVKYTSITSGDYLWAFCLGTQKALWENGRESILLTIDKVSPTAIGAVIALFERTTGFYAGMMRINAYNQPGVEAGKVCAEDIVKLKEEINNVLKVENRKMTVEEIGERVNCDDYRLIFYLVQHIMENSH